MPLHLRFAIALSVFGLVGTGVSLLGPPRQAAASGSAVAIAAGGELTCARVIKVGPLGIGARCVTSAIRRPELALRD